MPIIKTNCFILRGIKYKESSKIVTAYSQDYGKLSLLARGARRIKSKLGSGLDLFSYSEIIFYKRENREIYTVSNAEVIDPYSSIKNDMDKFNVASCISELIISLTPREHENEYIFDLLRKAFAYLDSAVEFDPQLLSIIFGFKLAVLLGYKPMLHSCVVCKNKTSTQNLYFSPSSGGIVCPDCTAEVRDRVKIDVDDVKYMEAFMGRTFESLGELRLSSVIKKKLGHLINRLLIEGSEKERNFCARYWV
ncbi:DNA repair protein RecO [bacterium]|nr:DNA repair protein RecO [bacterium]